MAVDAGGGVVAMVQVVMRALAMFFVVVVVAVAGCGAPEEESPREAAPETPSPTAVAPTRESTQTPPVASTSCEVDLSLTSQAVDGATELVGRITLAQQDPCGLDGSLGIVLVDGHGEVLQDEEGEIWAISGGEVQYVLTADRPTVTVRTRWTNWCGEGEVTARFEASGFAPEMHDPLTPECQDDSAPSDLSNPELTHR